MKKGLMKWLLAVSFVALLANGCAVKSSEDDFAGRSEDESSEERNDRRPAGDSGEGGSSGNLCDMKYLSENGYYVTVAGWHADEDPSLDMTREQYEEFLQEWKDNGWCVVCDKLWDGGNTTSFIRPAPDGESEGDFRIGNSEEFIQHMINKYNVSHQRAYIGQQEPFVLEERYSAGVCNKSEDSNNTNMKIIDSGTTCTLHAVQFVNETQGWIAGMCGPLTSDPGIVLHTEDGGESWMAQDIDAQGLYDISFVDENLGFAAGPKDAQHGAIYRTQDSGQNWTELELSSPPIMAVHFINRNVGVAVTLSCGHGCGTILRTEDGGVNWDFVSDCMLNPDEERIEALYDVYFPSSEIGFAVGHNGEIVKTTDGGLNWERKAVGFFSDINFEGVHFADEMTGYAVGIKGTNGPAGIVATTDGGETWVEEQSTAHGLLGVFAIAPERAVSVGYNEMFITKDSGTNWDYMLDGFSQDLLGVFFIDQNRGFMVGTSGTIIKYENQE